MKPARMGEERLAWDLQHAPGIRLLKADNSLSTSLDFPHVTSLMMDETALQTFAAFCVTGTPCRVHLLSHLTEASHRLFAQQAEETKRLEQEKISQAYALEKLQTCLDELS